MKKPELTLDNVRRQLSKKKAPETFRASDFLNPQELAELHRAAKERKKQARKFDEVDAFCAEIVARFGYDVYAHWKAGEIETSKISKWLAAERARDNEQNLYLEAIVIKMVGACIKKEKGQSAPKGPKEAAKLIREQIKRINGGI